MLNERTALLPLYGVHPSERRAPSGWPRGRRVVRSIAAAMMLAVAATSVFTLSAGHAHARAGDHVATAAGDLAGMADMAPSTESPALGDALHAAQRAGPDLWYFGIAPAVFWREIFPGMMLLLATAAGVSVGYWQLRREVVRRRAVEARLEAARDLADSAALAKSTFFTTMSHEIRTPLSGIIGMLDLVARTSMSAEQRQMLLAVSSSANSLLQILDQVMDFSKVEANRMSLESVPVDLRAIVQSVVMVIGEPARRRGVATSYEIDDAVDDALVGDPLRIRQILTNLMSNAAKFTSHGEVRLTLTVDAVDAAYQSLRFVVKDTGIGIPREKLAQVMTPFRQADSSISRQYGGTGLGLSVSSRLAALMGGTLTLDSEPGQGTRATFLCRLPVYRRVVEGGSSAATVRRLVAPAAAAWAGEESRAAGKSAPYLTVERAQTAVPSSAGHASEAASVSCAVSLSKVADSSDTMAASGAPRMLVVDDHAINRDLISRQLAILGYECDVRADGGAALEALRSGSYAMLLTDCQMPAMGGAELARAWRQEEQCRGGAPARLPIAMVTAKTDADQACGPDIDAAVRKPITLDGLRAVLLDCLPPQAVTAALAGGSAGALHDAPRLSPSAATSYGGLSLTLLRQQFHHDDAALRLFLRTSLVTLRSDLADAPSAPAPQLCGRYADWLHRVLGVLSMLGQWPVIDEGNKLEEALRRVPGPDLLPEVVRFSRLFERALDDIDAEVQRL